MKRYDIVGLANFTKALPHNDLGEVDPGAYRALLRALRSGRPPDFRRIPLGGRVKLANPEGAFSFELQSLGRTARRPSTASGAGSSSRSAIFAWAGSGP